MNEYLAMYSDLINRTLSETLKNLILQYAPQIINFLSWIGRY